MPRGYAPPNNLPGRVHTAADRSAYREMSRHISLLSDYTRMCFLLDLLLQLLLKLLLLLLLKLVLLLLSRSAHSHGVRYKIPHLLSTAKLPTIQLSLRGFLSCCCTSQPSQGYNPPCVQLRFHHRKVPTMGAQQPSLQHLGWRLLPTGYPLCPALEWWYSSQPGPRDQGPAPISSPVKLHGSLQFASSRVFASPVQPALLPGSLHIDGFHVLIIGLPLGKEKEDDEMS